MTDQRHTDGSSSLGQAVQDVTRLTQNLVREEVELAKTEVTTKAKSLAKGAGIGAAAGIFALGALVLILHGIAWLIWFLVFGDDKGDFFWGFFIEAGVLLLFAAIAGLIAARAFKKGSPPTPQMAIDEAQRIRATVQRPEEAVR